MGRFHVMYRKEFTSFPKVKDYRASEYIGVGVLEAPDKEEVFRCFQGEVWSPNGEMRDHINACGTDHTSMSTGDALIDPDGICWMCMPSGWEIIPDYRKN